jgi:hypothetical protein
MHNICLGGVISPAVVTFGKYSDRVYMTQFQSALKIFFRKFAADILHKFTCVEIEMDLSESHSFSPLNVCFLSKS